jgi:transposase
VNNSTSRPPRIPTFDPCSENCHFWDRLYQWQRTFFENGARAFEGSGNARGDTKLEKQVQTLESRLQRKHEVLSELMEEHIRLKKDLGEL